VNDLALRSISLFSGVGMLDEGLRAGLTYLGLAHRTVCHVEREAHAAAVLAARMAEGSMDEAPVWSDVTTFDAGAFRGRVDCIVAGFPCQDLSVAGRRAGLDGKRSGLFFEVVRIATDSGARLMFLENVSGIASATATVVDAEEGELDERAASRVVGELADCGWDAEWITLAASDVGASHGRARWFCLAWRRELADRGHDGHGRRTEGIAERHETLGQPAPPDCSVADPDSGDRPGTGSRSEPEHASPECRGALLGNTGLQHQHLQQRSHGAEHPRAGDELADAERSRDERRREPGDMACAGCDPEGQAHQRQRCGLAVDGGDGAVADAGCLQRSARHEQGRSGSAEAGRLESDHWPADCGFGLADASQQRPQEPIGGGNDRPHERQDAGAEPVAVGDALPLFAPGPADPRWPAILAENPELAPALEPAFRRVVDGVAFDMADSRSARLRCVGNGVVALQAAAAFVVLARRAMT